MASLRRSPGLETCRQESPVSEQTFRDRQDAEHAPADPLTRHRGRNTPMRGGTG
ncbi:hypothetical protein GCM10010151_35590 [Actinoallomurus spadix]|uniref:Uncharacterized protein n=1 Tax=Actinoallomurus spadix TaxID=79912 RepID=A0ABN0WNS7_9ACTN